MAILPINAFFSHNHLLLVTLFPATMSLPHPPFVSKSPINLPYYTLVLCHIPSASVLVVNGRVRPKSPPELASTVPHFNCVFPLTSADSTDLIPDLTHYVSI